MDLTIGTCTRVACSCTVQLTVIDPTGYSVVLGGHIYDPGKLTQLTEPVPTEATYLRVRTS